MKKNIIVADDNEYKRQGILKDLGQIYPDATYYSFGTANEATRCIIANKEDMQANPDDWLLVLDMQMPSLIGGEIKRNAGFYILVSVSRWINVDAIIVSSDVVNDVDTERLKESYPKYLGSVKYDCSVYMLPMYKELLNV